MKRSQTAIRASAADRGRRGLCHKSALTRRHPLAVAALLLLAAVSSPGTLRAAPFAEVAARDATLHDLEFIDARHGFAVGDRGVVLRTDDGGRSWTLLETPTNAPLYGVSFVDRQNGWAIGGEAKPYSDATRGVVLRTDDGGANWQAVPTETVPLLRWTRFFDRKNGVAVGAGSSFYPSGVFVTGDGGRSWQPLPGDRPQHWRAADFFTPQLGFAVADRGAIGMLAKQEVRPVGAAAGDRPGFHAITTVGQLNGWLVGDGGAVLKTNNAGRSWAPPEGAPPGAVQNACDWRTVAARGDRVWIAGSPGSVVLHSADGGRSWHRQATGVTTPLKAIAFADNQHGWAAGALGTLLATDDGGQTWRVQRRGGERLALDILIADRRDTPAALIAKQGAAEGYLTSVSVCFGDDGGHTSATDAARIADAAVSAGGAVSSIDWRLPLTPDQRRLAAEPLLAELNRVTDDRALDELVGALVTRFRTLRPAAIALVDPAGSASSGAAVLLGQAVEQAVALAADPAALPGLAQIGLRPWRVERVVQITPDALRSNGGFSTGDFEAQLGTSIAQWSSAAARLTQDTYQPPPSRVGWRTLISGASSGGPIAGLASGTRRGDLLAGISLARGGEARRPAATPPVGNLNQLRAAAQKRRNLEQLLARREGDDAWAGQVVNLTGGLDADSGATLLYQLAVGYRDAGKLDLAADTFYLLARRYQQHPLTEPALGWLLRYYASGEAVVHAAANAKSLREAPPLANVAAGVGINAVIPAGERPGTLTGDDRCQRATRLGAHLRDARPTLYADPAIRFAVAAAKRRLGYEKDAKRLLLLLGKQAVDPAWRRAADAERWLAKPTELPPDKPIAVCKSVATRPRLDGDLTDACWQGAEPITISTPRDSIDGETNDRGVVRLIRDEEFLYLAIDCPKMPGVDYQPPGGRRPRDGDLLQHDRVTLRIDTDRDYTTAFELTIDARGWPGDRLTLGAGRATRDWNPEWYLTASHPTDDPQGASRWRAEAAVPLSALATPPPTPRDVWAVAITRHAPAGEAATASWAPGASATPDRFGLLLMK